jgi:Invasin, domain 3/Glycosyl hydrolases family 18/Secretion system C-terminal sorting domain
MKKILPLLLLLTGTLVAQELGVYVPMWMMNPGDGDQYFSPATMDWTKISWASAFAVQIDSTKQPYMQILTGAFVNGVPSNGTDSAAFEFNYSSTNWLNLLVVNGHAHNAKILLTVDMVNPSGIEAVISKGEDSLDLWARSLVAYANRKGIDGIDLNIETWQVAPPTPTQISMMFRHLRLWMTNYDGSCSLLTIAPGLGNYNTYQKDSVNFYVDKIHIQFYAYDPVYFDAPVNSNVTWFINPIKRGSGIPSGCEGQGIEYDMANWVNAGYTKSKIEIGISTYAWVHQGVDSVMKPATSSGYATYQYAQASLSKGGTEHWDNDRQASWIGGTATSSFGSSTTLVNSGQKFYITTPSDSNTYYVAKYVTDNGLGGFWFYDLSMDHSEGGNPKNPVINYAQQLLLDQSKPPASKASILASFPSIPADGKSTVTITVQAKDSNGVNITNGGDVVVLVASGGTLSQITDHQDGTYTATLMSSKTAGPVIISGTINGKTISPTQTIIFSALRGLLSAAPQIILSDGKSTSTIALQVIDTNGVDLSSTGDNVVFSTTAGSLGSVTDHGDGTYSVKLTSAKVAALAKVTGTINGSMILDTADIIFTATIDKFTLISASPSLIPPDGVSTSTVTVQAKDTNNVDITTGGSVVTLLTTAGTLDSVVDNHNGTYTSTLTSSTLPGTAIIFGTINGATISDTATVIFGMPQGVINQNGSGLPTTYDLGQNYPNPFNPSTRISFALPKASQVQLKVFDMSGRVVATLVDSYMAAGRYSVTLNASQISSDKKSELASGVYLYRLETPDYSETKKLILLK